MEEGLERREGGLERLSEMLTELQEQLEEAAEEMQKTKDGGHRAPKESKLSTPHEGELFSFGASIMLVPSYLIRKIHQFKPVLKVFFELYVNFLVQQVPFSAED